MAKALAITGISYIWIKPDIRNTSLDVAVAFNPGKVPKNSIYLFQNG
jgi:hypothetical protein